MSDSNSNSNSNSHIVAQAIDKMTMFINMLLSSKEFDSSDDALDLLKNVVDNKQKLKEWESSNKEDVQIKRGKNKDIVAADHVAAKSVKKEDKQAEKAAAKQAEKEAKQAEKVAAKQAEKEAKQAEKAAAKQAEKAAKQAEKAAAKKTVANVNGNEKKSRGRPKKNMVQVVSQQQENSCIQRLILEEKEREKDEEEEENNSDKLVELDMDDFLEIEHQNTTYLVYNGDSNEHFKHGDAFTSDFVEHNDPRCGEYDFETERLVLC